MTVELIQERIATLTAERERIVANANALSGAIQDCQYWLEVLTQPQPSAEKVGPQLVKKDAVDP